MFRETNKILAAAAILLLASCGGKNSQPTEAEQLYQQASESLSQGDPDGCLALLDSIDRNHRSDLEVFKKSVGLRPLAMKESLQRQIASADSTLSAAEARLAELKPSLKTVEVPGAESYMTDAKSYSADFLNTTGIMGRVSEIGEFFIVSSVNPAGGLCHESIVVEAGAESVATDPVKYDQGLNFRIDGSEMITFSPAESEKIGQFVSDNADKALTVKFIGKNGKQVTRKLTADQARGIATAYRYAQAIAEARQAAVTRDKLTKMLEAANRQLGIDTD